MTLDGIRHRVGLATLKIDCVLSLIGSLNSDLQRIEGELAEFVSFRPEKRKKTLKRRIIREGKP